MSSTRFFSAGTLAAEDEIKREDAERRRHYIRAEYEGERLLRALLVSDEKVTTVRYYGQSVTDSLRMSHSMEFPGAPYEVISAPVTTTEGIVVWSTTYVDRDGAFRCRIDAYATNAENQRSGSPYLEIEYTNCGEQCRVEYEYNATVTKLLRITRVYPSGDRDIEYDAERDD